MDRESRQEGDVTPSSWPPTPEDRRQYVVLLFNPVEALEGWRWERTVVGAYRWAVTAWLVAYWMRLTRLHPMGFVNVMRREPRLERGAYR